MSNSYLALSSDLPFSGTVKEQLSAPFSHKRLIAGLNAWVPDSKNAVHKQGFMFPSTTNHEINYRINTQLNRVRLTLWEIAPKPSKSVYPYLYVLNYVLKSVEDAHQVLRDHLFVNGVATVDDLEFPFQGCIRVLPYPTWSSFEVCVEELIVSQAS